jgi:hypothetical protein
MKDNFSDCKLVTAAQDVEAAVSSNNSNFLL